MFHISLFSSPAKKKSHPKEFAGEYTLIARNSLGKQQHRVIVEVDGYRDRVQIYTSPFSGLIHLANFCVSTQISGEASNRGAAYFSLSSYQPEPRAQIASTPSMPSMSFEKKPEEPNKPLKKVQEPKPMPKAEHIVEPKVEEKIIQKVEEKAESPRRSKTPDSRSSRKSSPMADVPIPAPVEPVRTATPPRRSPTPTTSSAKESSPLLKKGLKDDTHEQDAYVVLEVEFDDIDRVEWSFNSGSLPDSAVIRETDNGSKVRIRSFASENAGNYTATGISKSGAQTSSSCHLYYGHGICFCEPEISDFSHYYLK